MVRCEQRALPKFSVDLLRIVIVLVIVLVIPIQDRLAISCKGTSALELGFSLRVEVR